ncbi:MAG: NADH-quinone oxidoreductase subunit J family protein [Planctomycetota bacterium]|jgi:NADH-quinone oxidoreductase subunit J
MPSVELIVFAIIAVFTVAATCVVTFSRNLIYSAFALLGTLFGSAALYGLLSSDFVAVTQLLVYVGGVLILILFAVMLTVDIGDINVTNKAIHWKMAIPLVALLFITLVAILPSASWLLVLQPESKSMVASIGNALLMEYLLPFEVISVLLLGALIGAVVLVRREVK